MILIVAFSFLYLQLKYIYFVTSLKMFVFRVHGSLEADISPKMPFEVSFSHDKNNLFTV